MTLTALDEVDGLEVKEKFPDFTADDRKCVCIDIYFAVSSSYLLRHLSHCHDLCAD